VLGERAALDGDALLATAPRAEAPALIKALVENGVDIEEARWIGADLEDVFMSETGWTGVQEQNRAG
jgi:ABC-2 type transport system ATP-binding protein